MRIKLERRREPSRLMLAVTPIASVLLTMVLGAVAFSLLGYNGPGAVREIFVSPLVNSYKWQDLAVKASPLIIIAVGLAISYRANVWNIGAEGQYVVGAIAGTAVGLQTNGLSGWWIMPLMMFAGVAGGAGYAAVPAFLRVRFRVNEILTTLMLTYVSIYLLNYLVFGPWKSPTSMGQPQTVMFNADQSLPYIVPGTIVQLNSPLALVVALGAWLVLSRFVFGFQIRVVGAAPQAARYGGFSADRTIWLSLLISAGWRVRGRSRGDGPVRQAGPAISDRLRVYRDYRCLSRAPASAGGGARGADCRAQLRGRGNGADLDQAAVRGGRHLPGDDAVPAARQRPTGALPAPGRATGEALV